MTRKAIINQADLMRMAAVAKKTGMRVEVEIEGVVIRVAPENQKPAEVEASLPTGPNAFAEWKKLNELRFGKKATLVEQRDAIKPRSKDDRRPFTPKTLAQRWHCSERHVRNMIAEGHLPAQKLGGKLLRIMFNDVDAFEQSGGTKSE
jgi:excisionase family DNA binding protein